MHASTSSLTVALVASATLFASQVEALPMTRSSSSVARRAHIATHHHHARASDLQLGAHAIVVDASSSGNSQGGGIKNSTINLTSISHQNNKRDSTFSGFSRVVRSLFGVSTTRRRSEAALPLTFAPSSAAATAAAPTAPKIATAAAAINPKGSKRTKRSHNNNKRARRSSRPRNFGKHPRPAVAASAPIINLKRRAPVAAPVAIENPKSTLVVPVAARYITRQVKRGGATYSEALAQASIYSAAIAALPESTPTTTAAVLADVAPTVAAYIASPQNNRNDSGSPYNGSPLINAPDGSYGNAAAARARSFSSTLSWASIAAASSTLSSSSSEAVPTSTTTPLVSVDSNGITWVQVATAALATPGPLSTSSTVINPKATLAVSSSSSSAALSASTSSSSSAALRTSPPPSTATLRR